MNYAPGPKVFKSKNPSSKTTEFLNSALEAIPAIQELVLEDPEK